MPYLGIAMIGVLVGALGGQVLAQVKGPTEHKGVSVTPLGAIGEESLKVQIGVEGYILRMRAVSVMPGGQIREHSHATRPGLVKMVSGEWIEGRPDGSETSYRAGQDVALLEDKDTVHWIYNRGDEIATGVVQARANCIVLTEIAGKIYTLDAVISLTQVDNGCPGPIRTGVVDHDNFKIRSDFFQTNEQSLIEAFQARTTTINRSHYRYMGRSIRYGGHSHIS